MLTPAIKARFPIPISESALKEGTELRGATISFWEFRFETFQGLEVTIK
jgi:hypothetical protein